MEIECEPKIEFGDFDSEMNLTSFDNCVELPPTWVLENFKVSQLSFTMPSISFDALICDDKKKTEEKADMIKPDNAVDVAKSSQLENHQLELIEMESNGIKCNVDQSDGIKHKVVQKSVKSFEMSDKIEMLPDEVDVEWDEKKAVDLEKTNVCNGVHAESDSEEKISDVKDAEETVANGDATTKETDAAIVNTQISKNSWAGLFKKGSEKNVIAAEALHNGHAENEVSNEKPIEIVQPSSSKECKPSEVKPPKPNRGKGVSIVTPKQDPNAKALAELLTKLELKFKPQAFIPRGLINSSNWCFINATLQALLMCPPFYQLLKSLPVFDCKENRKTATPTLDCFIKLAFEFHPLSSKKGYQATKEVRQGPPFIPDCVYEMLTITNSSLSEHGNQEDAEEFLSSVLNGLHEEMMNLLQLLDIGNESSTDDNDSPKEKMSNHFEPNENEWEEVITKRNRSAVTRRADTSKTLISKIFRGELCTSVFRPGQKLSISHEPFFCLPLAVQPEPYWSVEDALYALTNKENFAGSDNLQSASRQQAIEVLPPILILHLKRFVFDKMGGSKKIDKRMDFRSDLVIAKELLSKTSKKYTLAQRTYKLFAVVSHHGEKSTGGHYTADVFHIGMSSWLRIDDQKIYSVHHGEVTRQNSNRTPYLLFYRRTDLG